MSRPNNVLANALSRVLTSRTERKSTTTSKTMPKHLLDCLSFYPLHVEFPSDQSVMAICPAEGPPSYVAGQNATGQIHPGQCPLPTTVEKQDLFLEHPEFDAQGRLPFPYKTLYEYPQDDPVADVTNNKPTTISC